MIFLKYIFNILIFPGFLFCFFIGLLLLGIDRKIVARMQRRIGPPIFQPFYDFFKLVGKEMIVPSAAVKNVYLLAPIIGVISVITISLFIPINQLRIFNNYADVVVIIYLLAIPGLALILGGASSGSPFAGVGISREVVLMLAYELPLVIILVTVGMKAGIAIDGHVTFSLSKIVDYQLQHGPFIFSWSLIPAAIAFLAIIPCEIGTTPFDIADAETEICEGPLVEYSGLSLGLFKLIQGIKIFIMVSLFIALFASGLLPTFLTSNVIVNLIWHMILVTVIVLAVISLLRAITARLKIEQTFRFFWTYPTLLSVVSMVLVWIGL